jgi:adenosine deaminase
VRATIRHLRPDRIGHGVRAADDPSLVAELAERRIPLELCPISNVATGVYPDLAAHPLPALRDAGVVMTLNSDDPSMFGAWLTEVFTAARDTWHFDDAALADLARAGVDASFADPTTKTALRRDIDGWLGADAPAAAPALP